MPHLRLTTTAAIVAIPALVAAPAALGAGHYAGLGITSGSSTAAVRTGTSSFDVPGFPAGGDFTAERSVVDGRATTIGNDASGTDVIVPGSAFGQVFGGSSNKDYLLVRINSQGTRTVSTVTWRFPRALPPGPWGFSLGDIDVDEVFVEATGADGRPLSGQEIQGSNPAVPYDFLTGANPSMVLPQWFPQDGTSQRSLLKGSTPGDETQGAGGWFRPSKAVRSLTITFQGLTTGAGTPSYRTWLAVLAHPITGTVTQQGSGTPVPHATLTVEDPEGNVVAVAVTDANGQYAFPEVAARPGYTVQVRPPSGSTVVGPASQVVSTADGPAVANFLVTTGTSGTPGETGSSRVPSVVAYSEGDAALVVTPGAQVVRAGGALPMEIVTTCTASTTATVPAGLGVRSAPGATRSGRTVRWAGEAGPFSLTVKAARGTHGVKRVRVSTTCADGSTAAVTARVIVRRISLPAVPVSG